MRSNFLERVDTGWMTSGRCERHDDHDLDRDGRCGFARNRASRHPNRSPPPERAADCHESHLYADKGEGRGCEAEGPLPGGGPTVTIHPSQP